MLPGYQGQPQRGSGSITGANGSTSFVSDHSNLDQSPDAAQVIREMAQISIPGPSTANGASEAQETPFVSGSNGANAMLSSESNRFDNYAHRSTTRPLEGLDWSPRAMGLADNDVLENGNSHEPMLEMPMDYSSGPFSAVVRQQPLNSRRPWGSESSDESSSRPKKTGEEQVFRTGLVYSSVMMLHAVPCFIDEDMDIYHHPEKPERISAVFDKLKKEGCVARMKRIPIRDVTMEEVMLVHDTAMYNGVQRTAAFTSNVLAMQSIKLEKSSSLYINEHSARCARLSCGGVIEMCDAVAEGKIQNGFAIVRPPGHHAEPKRSMGFCFYNNVAVATRFVQEKYKYGKNRIKKVLILDWDVHHGNGTQAAFYDNEDVLYISLHRYDNGEFFPSGNAGNYDQVGEGRGKGKNVNIPWPCEGMTDADYMAAFQRIVMPIACEFAPDMVIISAGFDAAEGDELGLCKVTPTGYAQMTYDLASLANGKLVVALEGGYDLKALANSAYSVTEVLLGEIPPPFEAGLAPTSNSTKTFEDVEKTQSRYWNSIRQSPYHAIEDDSFGVDKFELSSQFAIHRLHAINKQYPDQFCALPLSRLPDKDAFNDYQIILSSEIFEAAFDTLVIFAHDAGNFRNDEHGVNVNIHSELGYFVDGSTKIVNWTQEKRAALIDVTLNSHLALVPKAPHLGNSRRNKSNMPGKSLSRVEQDRQLLLYAWDNAAVMVLAARPQTKVIIIGLGTACDAVLHLIETRDVASCAVKGVIQLPAYNLIPAISKDQPEKRIWYYKNSRVILPHDHVYYTLDAQAKAGKRLGKVFRSEEKRAIQVLRHEFKQIREYIDDRLSSP